MLIEMLIDPFLILFSLNGPLIEERKTPFLPLTASGQK